MADQRTETVTVNYPYERYYGQLHKMRWRAEFVDAWDNKPGLRFFMLEWARRHRKTSDALAMLVRDCMTHGQWVSLAVAPYLVQAREIVWDDPKMLFTILPKREHCAWEKNESKLMITFPNGSILRLEGGDKLEGRRGIDCNDLLLTEFSYTKADLWTKIFMPIMAGESDIPRRVIFDYTPCGQNHATDLFDWACYQEEPGQVLPTCGVADKLRPGWWVSRVTNDTTHFLSQEFLDQARDRWPTAIYDQEINCARVTDEEMTLITSAMVDALKTYHAFPVEDRHIISCDPSLGGDLCPILYIKNGKVEDERLLRERNSMIITGEIIAMGTKHHCENYVVDSTGISVGKAIVDRMYEQDHKHVYGFESAGKASDPARFANLKAEAWFYFSEEVHKHNVPYIEDQQTRQDICAVRYKVSDSRGRLILQPKLETKKLLGRSPDKGDALVQGVWRLKDTAPIHASAQQGDDSDLADSYAVREVL
jgi:hypothetical protein